ncbi:MAG: hypothetical protein MJB14_10215, partial [Spirochaetes bacterium]|nr:hypothetical protein [Spirochaetota bacterium]
MKKKVFLLFCMIFMQLSFIHAVEITNWIGERSYASNQTRPYDWEGDFNKLLNWTPEDDPDREYNRGTIPLQQKFTNSDYWVNPNASAGESGLVSIVGPWWPSESPTNYVSNGSDYFNIQTF